MLIRGDTYIEVDKTDSKKTEHFRVKEEKLTASDAQTKHHRSHMTFSSAGNETSLGCAHGGRGKGNLLVSPDLPVNIISTLRFDFLTGLKAC